MCEIHHEYTENDTFEGYKVVLTDKHGHHYSPYTGIRYIPGPVPEFKKMRKHITNVYVAEEILAGKGSYDLNHKRGRYTAVFVNYLDALSAVVDILPANYLPYGFTRNMLKMTISGNLRHGDYGGDTVILGDYIESVKVIKCPKTITK
jgi:hypothetical protein